MNRLFIPFSRRNLAPFRSYGPGSRPGNGLAWVEMEEYRLLQAPPPAYDEISQNPTVLYLSPSHLYESPPPDYETAIRLPPLEFQLPTTEREENRKILGSIGETNGHPQESQRFFHDTPARTSRTFNLDNSNAATVDFLNVELPNTHPASEDSYVRFTGNGISNTPDTREQLNGEITSTVVGGNIYNIDNRNYFGVDNVTTGVKLPQAVRDFILQALLTSTMTGLLIYFRSAYPQWIPQWAFVLLVSSLITALIRHLPQLFREYRND